MVNYEQEATEATERDEQKRAKDAKSCRRPFRFAAFAAFCFSLLPLLAPVQTEAVGLFDLRSLFRNAVQVFSAAEEELVVDDGGGGVDGVVQLVGRDDFQLVGVLDHDGVAAAADEIDVAAGCDR